ncbi:MAG TPA: hypothetical protein VN207_03905 [Ktedonobacteraceae bacterium]|nr:hypothetical protein [Ktedonobacteraceae bacterium]
MGIFYNGLWSKVNAEMDMQAQLTGPFFTMKVHGWLLKSYWMIVGSIFLKTAIDKKYCEQWKQKQGQVRKGSQSKSI